MTFKIPDYPFPYFRGKNGGIYRSMPDDDDDGLKIYDYDFYLVERLNDPVLGECSWFKLHLPKDGVREFIARTSDLLARDKARQILVDYGVIVHGKQMDLIIDYIVNTVATQQRTVETSLMHKQYGWNPGSIETKNKILIGNREISAFGVKYVPVAVDLNEINSTLQKKGDYEEWKKVLLYMKDQGWSFVLLVSFARLVLCLCRSLDIEKISNNKYV